MKPYYWVVTGAANMVACNIRTSDPWEEGKEMALVLNGNCNNYYWPVKGVFSYTAEGFKIETADGDVFFEPLTMESKGKVVFYGISDNHWPDIEHMYIDLYLRFDDQYPGKSLYIPGISDK